MHQRGSCQNEREREKHNQGEGNMFAVKKRVDDERGGAKGKKVAGASKFPIFTSDETEKNRLKFYGCCQQARKF